MLDKTMTEDELAEQAKRYGHHYFRTCRQVPIRINDKMPLRDAFDALDAAEKRLTATRAVECIASGEKYRSAQAEILDAAAAYEDQKAQAMAAFYRETGRWPYEMYRLGLR